MSHKLSTKQQLFQDAAIQGDNIFLTGKAGTGKSFIVKQVIAKLNAKGKRVAAIAPTGIAANNIQGTTIHSLFSIRPYGVINFEACNFVKSEKRRLLQNIDTIIIDEISMLRPDILDAMHWTLLKNGCPGLSSKQIIFVGDLKQLPSPMDDNMASVLLKEYEGEEFYQAHIYEELNPKYIELDEVQRQTNEEFIFNLNIVREGGRSPYFKQFLTDTSHGIILAPHNSTVKTYNEIGLKGIDAHEHVFTATITGNAKADEFNLENIIKVKHGAKIMYLANSKNNDLINGTLGTFVDRGNKFFINVNGVEHALMPMEFTKHEYVLNEKKTALELREIGSITQYPIRLAYALTIHKSQGLTFDKITIDLTLPCFSKGQLYTALSRVREPEGLKIIAKR